MCYYGVGHKCSGSNSKRLIRCDNFKAELLGVKCGVSQGSVLLMPFHSTLIEWSFKVSNLLTPTITPGKKIILGK